MFKFISNFRAFSKRFTRFGEDYFVITPKYWTLYGLCLLPADRHVDIQNGLLTYDKLLERGRKSINYSRAHYILKKKVSIIEEIIFF